MDKIVKFLKNNKVAKSSELLGLVKNRMELTRLVEKGELKKLGHNAYGFYILPDEDELQASLMVVKKYYPNCIISGDTALTIYELGDDYIRSIDVDIAFPSGIRNSLLRVHQVSTKRLCHITDLVYQNISIKIYTPERCLYEALFHHGTGEVFFKAINNYRNNFKIDYDIIIELDQRFKKNVLSFIQMGDVTENAY